MSNMQEFDLTQDQVRSYLEDVKQKQGEMAPAGFASEPYGCPLVLAYKHAHPDAGAVSVGIHAAFIGVGPELKSYALKPWHSAFTGVVDASAVAGRFVSVRFCLNTLDSMEGVYGKD